MQTIRRTLLRKNGYMYPNCGALITEANDFNIGTPKKLRKLLLKHRRVLIADDLESILSSGYMRLIAEEHGESYAAEIRRKQRCFTWEGQVRLALELEFGQRYEAYSFKRDGI